MNKRDLKADLELCNKATANAWYWSDGDPIVVGTDKGEPILWIQRRPEPRADDITFLCNAREGWPHAIERALKAELLVWELAEILNGIQGATIVASLAGDCEDGIGLILEQVGRARPALAKIREVLVDDSQYKAGV